MDSHRSHALGLAFCAVLFVATVACPAEKEVKVITQTMELSDAAKVVQRLEPVIDNRWAKPLCFLAADFGSSGKVVLHVPCDTIRHIHASRGEKKAVVIDHQTLNPPQTQPAEEPPPRKLGDVIGDAGRGER